MEMDKTIAAEQSKAKQRPRIWKGRGKWRTKIPNSREERKRNREMERGRLRMGWIGIVSAA
jgi:hypothetical protein